MRKWLAGFLAALAAMAPAAAAAQSDTVTLEPGSYIRFSLDAGRIKYLDGGGTQPSAFEAASAARLEAGQYGPQVGTNLYTNSGDGLPAPGPIADDQIRIGFFHVGDRQSVYLSIENGYDRAFVYRAVMQIDGKSRPTDVCIVVPKRRGFEHWPHRIDRIFLSSLSLQPWKPGDAVTCA